MENDRILVAGSIRKDVNSKYDAFLIQINSRTMKQEGMTTWGGSQDDFANALLCDNGNNYIAGETGSFGPGPPNAFLAMPEFILLPDLVVSITIKEITALVASSRDYQIQIVVSNVGTNASIRETHMILSIDNVSIWDTDMNPLGLNQSILARYPWNGPNVGIHEISIVVDPDNVIPELNETNNAQTINFEVQSMPPLNSGTILLASVAVIVGLIVLALMIFIVNRRKKARRPSSKDGQP
jgi:hypothetical protein